MLARPKRDLYRININLPTHIVEMVDDYASKHGLSRTTAMVILLANALADVQREERR